MGLKDRLATRQRPTVTYSLRIDDDTRPRSELAAAQADGDEGRIVAAQLAVEACYEQLTITALSPLDMEELIQAHQPTDELRKRNANVLFNPATFVPALFAACVDSDVDEESWAEYTSRGPMTPGETNSLFNAVWGVNYREPDPALPKG